jgi:hypothetical protein
MALEEILPGETNELLARGAVDADIASERDEERPVIKGPRADVARQAAEHPCFGALLRYAWRSLAIRLAGPGSARRQGAASKALNFCDSATKYR